MYVRTGVYCLCLPFLLGFLLLYSVENINSELLNLILQSTTGAVNCLSLVNSHYTFYNEHLKLHVEYPMAQKFGSVHSIKYYTYTTFLIVLMRTCSNKYKIYTQF